MAKHGAVYGSKVRAQARACRSCGMPSDPEKNLRCPMCGTTYSYMTFAEPEWALMAHSRTMTSPMMVLNGDSSRRPPTSTSIVIGLFRLGRSIALVTSNRILLHGPDHPQLDDMLDLTSIALWHRPTVAPSNVALCVMDRTAKSYLLKLGIRAVRAALAERDVHVSQFGKSWPYSIPLPPRRFGSQREYVSQDAPIIDTLPSLFYPVDGADHASLMYMTGLSLGLPWDSAHPDSIKVHIQCDNMSGVVTEVYSFHVHGPYVYVAFTVRYLGTKVCAPSYLLRSHTAGFVLCAKVRIDHQQVFTMRTMLMPANNFPSETNYDLEQSADDGTPSP